MFSRLMILSSISCVLSVRLSSEVPVQVPEIFIFRFPSVCILYWFFFHFQDLISFIYFSDTVCLNFIKWLIHFLVTDIYHIHKGYFMVFVFCSRHVAIRRSCCSGVAGCLWRPVVVAVIDCIYFMVPSRHLGLWRQ